MCMHIRRCKCLLASALPRGRYRGLSGLRMLYTLWVMKILSENFALHVYRNRNRGETVVTLA